MTEASVSRWDKCLLMVGINALSLAIAVVERRSPPLPKAAPAAPVRDGGRCRYRGRR